MLKIKVTWPLAFVILLAVVAYLLRANQKPARRAAPRPASSQRPPMTIHMPPSHKESADSYSAADLDDQVREAVRKANIHSDYTDLAENFRQSGAKRRAAYANE